MRARKTKHITRACVGCRKRKTKCDGAKPQCANCALYQQTCTFSTTIDKRKMASKDRLSMMVTYIQDLEALVIANGLDLPSIRPDILLPPVAASAPVETQPSESPKVFPTWPSSEDQEQMLEDRSSVPSTENSPATHCSLSVSTESSSVLNTLSSRIGSLQMAEDGQLRFFGPTSNLHISHVGPFPLFNSNIRSVHRTEELIFKAAGVGHHVDEELEDHLTKLYFAWENPNIPIVDEKTYYEEKMRYRKLDQHSHRYSEVLTNAMYVSAHLSGPRMSPRANQNKQVCGRRRLDFSLSARLTRVLGGLFRDKSKGPFGSRNGLSNFEYSSVPWDLEWSGSPSHKRRSGLALQRYAWTQVFHSEDLC